MNTTRRETLLALSACAVLLALGAATAMITCWMARGGGK